MNALERYRKDFPAAHAALLARLEEPFREGEEPLSVLDRSERPVYFDRRPFSETADGLYGVGLFTRGWPLDPEPLERSKRSATTWAELVQVQSGGSQ